jgi:DNA-binding LacI/PurR family transcriptional regulator
MATPPTMREIAALAGCTQTTVSLALRNHPRISAATRDRILAIADKAGYTRDPLVSTLMNQLRSSRKTRTVEKLAMITWWDTPGARQTSRGRALHDGIYARAHHLGYDIEEFWAREPRMTLARLGRILHTRSIRGLIFMSMLHARGRVSFDWKHFAVAAVGQTILKPGMHHAAHGFYHGMVLTLRNLKRLGYTRVGYVNVIEQDDMSNNVWLSAYMGYQYRTKPDDVIPPLLTPRWDRAALAKWIERHKIQAVVANMHEVMDLLRETGRRVPEDVGFASLDCLPSVDSCAGVDILRDQIGAKTVDLVVEQLQNNELGLPDLPKVVSVEGMWCDGDTLRKRTG